MSFKANKSYLPKKKYVKAVDESLVGEKSGNPAGSK